ncbi:GNAT family N-acetyltransferase [Maribacter sp. 2-571]|uniref:GNAT family N-acetyltransferase n=1 Tax=Maribacter sp. 2-571 TaxID=3417569 RepID=UPI003D34A0B8
MDPLKGEQLYLRALEPEDLDFLYETENNTALWEISSTITPYSKHVLRYYLENAHRDIYDVKQLRLVICSAADQVMGLIDLFDFDPIHKRAGIGIVVLKNEHRNSGVGTEAISVLLEYAFHTLDLHQVYANVGADNDTSMHLFQKLGFVQIGVKCDWLYTGDGYKDEILFQKIKE